MRAPEEVLETLADGDLQAMCSQIGLSVRTLWVVDPDTGLVRSAS